MQSFMFPVDERLIIRSSEDKMKATAIFCPNEKGGKPLEKKDIITIINESKVSYGLNQGLIAKLLEGQWEYNKSYEIASGYEGADGEDGKLECFFNTGEKNYTPKVTGDGTVDYKNLGLIEYVEKGTLLARITPPTKAINGKDVYGKELRKVHGKAAPRLPKGRNTQVSEDGMTLIASESGQILYINGIVSIMEFAEIKGDVDNSTGNINFNGSVVIHGNVLSGFKVHATGNIDIRGFIEGGEVISGGNIKVGKEIIGMNKSYIEAKGNINCMLIKNADVYTQGNIYSDGIMHSNIKCDGSLELKGKKGILVGGKAVVRKEIDANIIGSPMSTNTEIKVGIDVEVFDKYRVRVDELLNLRKHFEEVSAIISGVNKIKDVNLLPEVKKKSYINTLYEAQRIKNRIDELQEEVITLKGELDKYKHSGKVYARQLIHSGVNLQIGNAIINIKDSVYGAIAVNEDGYIKLLSI